jgi:hypothetical protein
MEDIQVKFMRLAGETLEFTNNSKVTSEGKKNKQAELSFLILQIFLAGKLQDTQRVRKTFSKGGPYHTIRMVMSRANAVALHVAENGNILVKTKDMESEFTKAQILAPSDAPLFNVSTAYNSIKADKVAPVQNKEQDAIDAFLASQGYGTKEFKDQCKIDPAHRDYAIEQGLILLAEADKKAILENLPAMAEKIFTDFIAYAELAPNEARKLLKDLKTAIPDVAQQKAA